MERIKITIEQEKAIFKQKDILMRNIKNRHGDKIDYKTMSRLNIEITDRFWIMIEDMFKTE